jgi:hypothetical protein
MMTTDFIAQRAKNLPLEEKLLFIDALQEFLETGSCPLFEAIEKQAKCRELLGIEFTLAGIKLPN